MLVMLLKSSSL
jgi:hypothetical protein